MSDSYANILKYKPNWEETKERFNAWWNRSKIGRPMLRINALRDKPLASMIDIPESDDAEYLRTDPVLHSNQMRNTLNNSIFMAEAIPNTNINLGPGSLAVYLGSEPIFDKSTVWFTEIIENWENFPPLKYDSENFWYKRHLELIKKQHELANGEYFINIPDLIENIDIISALRGPLHLCYDLMDCPETIKDYINQIDDLYTRYYDSFYDIVKGPDGDCCFTCFQIWGPGKTVKLQSDFSAMMSPDQFREFVIPSFRKMCKDLGNTLYHLDGPDAIRHVDALMELEGLDALQWVPGAGNAPAAEECWWEPVWDKVKKANKSIWLSLAGKTVNECVESADKFIKRYGSDGVYLLFPGTSEQEGKDLIKKAEKDWC